MDLFFFVAFLTFSLVAGFPSHEQSEQSNTDYNLTEYSSFQTVSESLNCPERQHWEVCAAHCAKNCNNFNESNPCLPVCVSGCVCDIGYVFDSSRNCIPPTNCQVRTKLNSHEVEAEDFCPPNEEFSPCLAHCQRNCINWSDSSLPCLKVCTPGCVCKKRRVRGPHGTCIRLRQCPPRKSLGEMAVIECPVDEHFDICSAHCQKKCSNWDEPMPCPRVCIPGCVCDRGLVRGPTGKCIFPENCPTQEESTKNKANDDTTVVCPNGEHRSEFQSFRNSRTICIHRNRCFIDLCPPTYSEGCVCDRGLTRDPENRCSESRLKPRANDLQFMHESPYAVNDERNSTIDLENLEIGSSMNETTFIADPELRDSPEQRSCNLTSLPDEDIVQYFLNESKKYKTDMKYGCENRESCVEWCMTRGIRNGLCDGSMFCVCLQRLE